MVSAALLHSWMRYWIIEFFHFFKAFVCGQDGDTFFFPHGDSSTLPSPSGIHVGLNYWGGSGLINRYVHRPKLSKGSLTQGIEAIKMHQCLFVFFPFERWEEPKHWPTGHVVLLPCATLMHPLFVTEIHQSLNEVVRSSLQGTQLLKIQCIKQKVHISKMYLKDKIGEMVGDFKQPPQQSAVLSYITASEWFLPCMQMTGTVSTWFGVIFRVECHLKFWGSS